MFTPHTADTVAASSSSADTTPESTLFNTRSVAGRYLIPSFRLWPSVPLSSCSSTHRVPKKDCSSVANSVSLSENDVLRKEVVVHDLTICTVASHQKGKKYDGHNLPSVATESLSPARQAAFDKHEKLHKFSSAGVQSNSEVCFSRNSFACFGANPFKPLVYCSKFLSALETCHRPPPEGDEDRIQVLQLSCSSQQSLSCLLEKCADAKCHYCSQNGIQTCGSTAMVHKSGGSPTPTADSNNPGHLMSYLDMPTSLLTLQEKPAAVDQ